MNEPHLFLDVWRLHPHGVRIVPADKRLLGQAPAGALKWCGPFTYANRAGWWIYPPFDIDIIYRPPDESGPYDEKYDNVRDCHSENMMHGSFDFEVVGDYEHGEEAVITEMLRPHHRFRDSQRQLYAFGDVEMNVASIWTGCVFKTPPGWCLHIRSPINIGLDTPFRIQEGILETDWMQYDIWMNLKFTRYNEWVSLRRTQPLPLAQLVPVRRESYDGNWDLRDNVFTIDGPLHEDAERVFDRWNDYNYQKWMSHGRKDPATHHKERKKANYRG